MQHSGHTGKKCLTKLIVEIYSKSQLELLVKTHEIKLEHQLKPIEVMKMGLCCKQTAV